MTISITLSHTRLDLPLIFGIFFPPTGCRPGPERSPALHSPFATGGGCPAESTGQKTGRVGRQASPMHKHHGPYRSSTLHSHQPGDTHCNPWHERIIPQPLAEVSRGGQPPAIEHRLGDGFVHRSVTSTCVSSNRSDSWPASGSRTSVSGS